MAMIFCRGCGKEIHDSATACPHCGATQSGSSSGQQGSKWMAITALVLGIFAILATMAAFADGADSEQILGIILFGVVSLVFAIISLVQKRWGKGLSIAGIVMSAISLLALFGA
ncbi:zinc ribbon domain-containing protein [Castellaniella sp.]|uniref:zinc ribbon domain-containing protein n=1 Tax=Castellaniella sp. TaxID=1955812 RepID=UPI002AFF8006|nr:zinc ribbon domain-containing protein [Castellaniella sp.]